MRHSHLIPLALLACLAQGAAAQSGGVFDLSWSTIDSGGAVNMSGGAFTLSGAIGQLDAGDSANGAFGVSAGFWPVPMAAPVVGCNEADLSEPFGVLDFTDVIAFLGAFGAMDPAADLAAPFGVFDFSDILTFLGAFGDGCP